MDNFRGCVNFSEMWLSRATALSKIELCEKQSIVQQKQKHFYENVISVRKSCFYIIITYKIKFKEAMTGICTCLLLSSCHKHTHVDTSLSFTIP